MEPITILNGKHIILAVTGSIACYKSIDLASKLSQAGALVDVILTDAAQRFVTPLTFQSVTGRPVYTDMWATRGEGLPTHIAHVGLGEGADLLVVAPATANSIAKLSYGMADNLLMVTALAARCPLMIAPAMDGGMYAHDAVQNNLQLLIERGAYLAQPEEGRFASGLVGLGRLPETRTLIGHIRRLLGRHGSLEGRKVVVSAGGTREDIDPVRYVTNHSSGKQGYALAQAAIDAGAADVVLVSASVTEPVPVGAQFVPVGSAASMLEAILEHGQDADLLVMAAAVADFRPITVAGQKIKKKSDSDEGLMLRMVRTDDILMNVKAQRDNTGYPRIVVGFAAESENLLHNARSKLQRKGVDLLVANDITAKDAGFQADTNQVLILDADGGQRLVDLASKASISEDIILLAADLLGL